MSKILSGFIGLFLVVGLVGGTAYALFSSSVNMQGMVLGTATAGLTIRTDEPGLNTHTSTLNFQNQSPFKLLVPGELDWGEFWLKNDSTSNGPELTLALKGRLTTAAGDWGVLKDAVRMRICYYSTTPGDHCDENNKTNWMTLAEWNTTARDLPGPLVQGPEKRYAIQVLLPSNFDNTVAGKQISNLNFEIVGTQLP